MNLPSLLKSFTFSWHPNPARDWLLLLLGGAVLLVVSLAWNLWFFNYVVTAEPETELEEASAEVEAYPLATVQKIFSEREALRARYLAEPRFIDPSR